jgi:glycosyltransferase involved in cell wall biosynthesis
MESTRRHIFLFISAKIDIKLDNSKFFIYICTKIEKIAQLKAEKRYKIVYCTPALYMAGGVERVLTIKANYFADVLNYNITIILTEGKDRPLYYPLSERIKVVNLDINFEELWSCSFLKKIIVYLKKQKKFKKRLTAELMTIRPDITISLLRREINFITKIHDGSKKVGELHVNRANYRNFESGDSNIIKNLFSKFWMNSLVSHLQKLDRFVVLTEEDKQNWPEIQHIEVIPNPLAFKIDQKSDLTSKRVIAVGRYAYQKGFDLLLKAWSKIEHQVPEWSLVIYGQGDRSPYELLIEELKIDRSKCHLCGPTDDIKNEYLHSSLFVFSSRFEGFGMVLVEAMACGLPVVSTDCPCGPKDIVADGEDGLLVSNGDVDALSEAMKHMINDEILRRNMQSKALCNVKRFDIRRIAQRWKQLFEDM